MELVYDLGFDAARRLEDARSMAERFHYSLVGSDMSGLLRRGDLVVGTYILNGSLLTFQVYVDLPGLSEAQLDSQLRACLGWPKRRV